MFVVYLDQTNKETSEDDDDDDDDDDDEEEEEEREEEEDDDDDGDEGETSWGRLRPKVNPWKSSSQYKGVYLDTSKASRNSFKPWRAQIKTPKGVESLGYFSNEESAAKAYDRRARGLNMALNLPNGTSRSKQVRHTYYMTMRGLTLSPG